MSRSPGWLSISAGLDVLVLFFLFTTPRRDDIRHSSEVATSYTPAASYQPAAAYQPAASYQPWAAHSTP